MTTPDNRPTEQQALDNTMLSEIEKASQESNNYPAKALQGVVEDKSIEEVAHELQFSTGTLRRVLKRALLFFLGK